MMLVMLAQPETVSPRIASTMAQMMNVPILGVIENMSYLSCPDCGKRINVFGESKAELIAKELGVPVLATLPMDPAVASLVDQGKVEYIQEPQADAAFASIKNALA